MYKKGVEELLVRTMASPKNWTKEEADTLGIEHKWVNRQTGSEVKVVLHGTYVHGGINRPSTPYAIKLNQDFIEGYNYKSMDEARKRAVEWMRNHPNM